MFPKFFCFLLPLLMIVPVYGETRLKLNLEVEKYKLENGLQVLLHKDTSVPIVSYHTWFRVGSVDERPGITGIAHLFEHLMFKETKNYKDGEFDQILQANGATNNAFTSHDMTGYYENIPSSKLELIMKLESDRMVNLLLNDNVLKSEREVVKEERRIRVDNSPFGKLREAVFATVFKVHPYRWPVIGWMSDLNSMTLSDLQKWYKTYYAPNNAILVIVGDIDISDTKSLIDKYYGPLKASELPKNTIAPEPEQNGFRQATINSPVQSPIVALSYLSPEAGTDEALILDMASSILGDGKSSRLYRRLVDRQHLATQVGSYNYTPKHKGIFQLYASMTPGADPSKVQTALMSEVYNLRTRKVTEEELAIAKTKLIKDFVDSLKTMDGKARVLASNEMYFDDYRRFFKDMDRYNQITADDIMRVSKKYLVPSKANYVTIKP